MNPSDHCSSDTQYKAHPRIHYRCCWWQKLTSWKDEEQANTNKQTTKKKPPTTKNKKERNWGTAFPDFPPSQPANPNNLHLSKARTQVWKWVQQWLDVLTSYLPHWQPCHSRAHMAPGGGRKVGSPSASASWLGLLLPRLVFGECNLSSPHGPCGTEWGLCYSPEKLKNWRYWVCMLGMSLRGVSEPASNLQIRKCSRVTCALVMNWNSGPAKTTGQQERARPLPKDTAHHKPLYNCGYFWVTTS